jgi:hypothetical protein
MPANPPAMPARPPTMPANPPTKSAEPPTKSLAVGRATPAEATERLGDGSGRGRRRLRILIAAAAVLAIAVSVPITVRLLRADDRQAGQQEPPAASASAPACGFTEEFAGAAVDPVWERNRQDQTIAVSGGAASFNPPNGADIFKANMTAPMLLRPITGDFVLEATVEALPTVFYQGAGLLLWNGPNSYVRIERGFGGTGTVGFEYKDGGPHKWVHGPLPSEHPIKTEATRLVLRMARTGGTITGSWRPADKLDFAELAHVPMTLPQTVRVGVAALNRAQLGAKPTPFHARVERIAVTC